MTNSQKKDEEKKSVAPIVTAAVIGAVIGAAIGFVVTTGTSGDEAPIKVKNGSLDIELIHVARQWEPWPQSDTSKMHWRAKGGSNRNQNLYSLIIDAANGKCLQTAVTGNRIRFTYADSKFVEIEAKNKKTEVLSDVALELLSNDRLLRYKQPSDGYIASISISGVTYCTFTAAADLTGLYMNEP